MGTRRIFDKRLKPVATLRHSRGRDEALLSRLEVLGQVGWWVWEPATNHMRWSPHLFCLLGVPPSEAALTFETYRALLRPEDREEARCAILQAIAERTPFFLTQCVQRQGGDPCWLEVSGEVLGGAGEPVRVLAFCRDVTAQRVIADEAIATREALEKANEELQVQAEELRLQAAELAAQAEAIEEQRSLLESLVTFLPAGVAYLDEGLASRWTNPPMRGLERQLAAAPEAFERPALEALATGQPQHVGNVMAVDAAGEAVRWDLSFVPVSGSASVPGGLLVFGVDVTARWERERLQRDHIARLEEIDRYKDEFLAVLSHELRTPLHFILGFGTLLEDGVQGPLTPDQGDSMRRIVAGTERMLHLVDDLLEIARIRAGKLVITPAGEPLGPLVSEVVASSALQAEAAGITLESDVPEGLVAWCDAHRTTQVIRNLVGNALKFTPKDGRVSIVATRRASCLLVEVRDTGPGIPEEQRERVFQKFEQLDMSATRPQGGVGLGLAIAHGLVTAQGGEIGVRGAAGGGACFWFTLPCQEAGRLR